MIVNCGKVGLRSDGDYDYEMFVVRCDSCKKIWGDKPQDKVLTTFKEAVDYRKRIGIRSVKIFGKWFDFCPACYKSVRGRQHETMRG